jgi:hypothetical protein
MPEALNASGSKRACRMAIRRNACSLLALPDFPEFAQAVRYGVPGTPKQLGMVSPVLTRVAIATAVWVARTPPGTSQIR